MHHHRTLGSRLFDYANVFILTVVALTTLFPFVYILATSLSPTEQVVKGGLILWPETFVWDAYRSIFTNSHFVHSLWLTIGLTIIGTVANLLFTTLMAYPLAKKRLKGRSALMFLVLFTMLFSGGMIPTYIVVKQVHLLNTMWALIVPGLIGAFHLIVLKNFFQSIPEELEEAARIDGCRHTGVLFRVVIPLSMPAIATFTLFYAVEHWNQFFNAVLYITKPDLWTVQVFLRQMIFEGSTQDFASDFANANIQVTPMTIKMAAIIVATLPILVVYPFLQKHFAKGVMLGSVKG